MRIVPCSVSSTWPCTRSVRGSWPMATNRPVTSSVDASPVRVSRRRRVLTLSSPVTSVTSVFQRNSIFSFSMARWAITLEARSSSLRTSTVTLDANFVRNRASSMAESPPPTTAISCSRKKKPSHVAHQLTPWPERRSSPGTPSFR